MNIKVKKKYRRICYDLGIVKNCINKAKHSKENNWCFTTAKFKMFDFKKIYDRLKEDMYNVYN